MSTAGFEGEYDVQTILEKGTVMNRISPLMSTFIAVVGVVVFLPPTSGRADETARATFLTEIPQGYRDLTLISVSRLTAANGSQLRAELGNAVAIKAYREGRLPFPDGAIIAALHWKETSSEENNQVLAMGFPGAGVQSFIPSSALNVQFMVKDSTKYAATGGWGFGDFTNGKPANEALMKTCFGCHQPAKDRDFVFTRYSPRFDSAAARSIYQGKCL